MSLSIKVVASAKDGLDVALNFLHSAKQATELFEPLHVVIPTAGMREWLIEQIMRHDLSSFGIVMNTKFHFVGGLYRDLTKNTEDPWAIDTQVALLLGLLGGNQQATEFIQVSGGLLPAADRLASMFERYITRRPAMIRDWDASRIVGPIGQPLATADKWQAVAWQALRAAIGCSPTKLPDGANPSDASLPNHVLLFGFEMIDHRMLAALQSLGTRTEVEVVVIHPSPCLADHWASLPVAISGMTEMPPSRLVENFPYDVLNRNLVLPYRWLRSAKETQKLLTRAGVTLDFASMTRMSEGSPSRLHQIQHVIAYGREPRAIDAREAATDHSVVLHRCHGLARQAEVAVDAVLAAMQEIPELQLHEIAIMTPDVHRMAPHLRAAFGRSVMDSRDRKVALPLVIADRTLGEIDDGARVFSNFVTVLGGRMDADSVLALLSDPALAKSRRLGPEAITRWGLHLQRAGQRWGLSADHRKSRHHLDITDHKGQPDEQHSWIFSARRILLGAASERDGVETLLDYAVVNDVETDELDDILTLVEILEILARVVETQSAPRTASEWASILDQAFTDLCGEYSELTKVPKRELRRLASLDSPGGTPIPIDFLEVGAYLLSRFTAVPERQVVRTGGILATNLGAQRLVPYRFICVVGLDDASMPSAARDGFDLSARDNLEGDPDPRHDLRRLLLDALVSATDRFVMTCDGRDLKNNQDKELALPLDELVSWCADIKLPIPEITHPRHLHSLKNFMDGELVAGRPWAHDEAARRIAEAMKISSRALMPDKSTSDRQSAKTSVPVVMLPKIVSLRLSVLKQVLFYPLEVFLQWSYNIRRDWESAEVDTGTLALDLTDRELFALADVLASAACNAEWEHAVEAWKRDNRRLRRLPVTDSAKKLTEDRVASAVKEGLKLLDFKSDGLITSFRTRKLELEASGVVIEGDVPTVDPETVVLMWFDGKLPHKSDPKTDDLMIKLLFWRSLGLAVNKVVIIAATDSIEATETGKSKFVRCEMKLSESISPETAQAWLSEVVTLYRRAAITPIPTFEPNPGKPQSESAGHLAYIDEDIRGALDKFQKAISKAPQGTYRGYSGGEECLLFGAEPEFVRCFPGVEIPVASVQITGNSARITLEISHGLEKGSRVKVTNTGTVLDGEHTVTATPEPNELEFRCDAPDGNYSTMPQSARAKAITVDGQDPEEQRFWCDRHRIWPRATWSKSNGIQNAEILSPATIPPRQPSHRPNDGEGSEP